MIKEEQSKKNIVAQKEEEVLSFWDARNIFKKTLEKKSSKNFVFYDGPPFATGLPHYGHLLASTIKDVIPRYKTMRGYHVRRQWGWDCHGLPIENLIESELGLERKKDIEKFGIEKFNEAAKNSVLRYDSEWKKVIQRLGRWVDMENDYRTMDPEYTESIWWAFKTLYDKSLIYEGYKSMHICPRCETTLAVSEVGMAYKDITDISVVVKFELEDDPNVYLLAWTTTPWTLPGNVALAVNEKLKYSKIKITNDDTGVGEVYIVAKNQIKSVFKNNEYSVVDELSGSELVNKKYIPVFNYYSETFILKNREKGWRVYPASFVSTEEGTGIVHVAPAFGENDMALGEKHDLPFVQHVSFDGTFKKEVVDFNGLPVKPKNDHQAADIEIIKYLSKKNLLFSKEKITHSYPHCWRCDTPLLNYAASSWFVKVTKLKSKLISINKKILWVPGAVRLGRFGKWLEGARDWAISRSRFWGAPIPVWKCDSCKKNEVIGGIDDIKKKIVSSGNFYFVMRHGEAKNNTKEVVSSNFSEEYSLTESGIISSKKTSSSLKNKNIDLIFSSPLPRARETAHIAAEQIGISVENIIFDSRLTEVGVGEFEGKSTDAYIAHFSSPIQRFGRRPSGGENLLDVKKRTGEFLNEIDEKYKNKKILLVSHADAIWQIWSAAFGWNSERALIEKKEKKYFIKNSEILTLPYVPLPKNSNFEIDLHRPYIDKIEFRCKCGGTMKRIKEVFDCWFESGSMPFAQFHYPFENQKLFKKNFPAHFIAEGLDQTRGWFYNMLVLSTGLFGRGAFKSVIVNGLILSEDGQKMSKKLKNYPDPIGMINKYGADSLRYYFISSPVVRGENLNFSEKDVQETMNKIITRLRNVFSFYELYRDDQINTENKNIPRPDNILDRWILVRLSELINKTTYAMERYEIDKAIRPIGDFIEDLSVWYIRRSRNRFKNEKSKNDNGVFATTRFVLTELVKVMAPFTPFIAEELYGKIITKKDIESVHLSSWPEVEPTIPVWPNPMALVHRLFGTHKDLLILSDMTRTREIVSLGLEVRQKTGIKVRQPLSELIIKKQESRIKNNNQLTELIKEELNVKKIIFGADIKNDVELNTKITTDLKKEGQVRELIRHVQGLRKKEELLPSQRVSAIIKTSDDGKHFIKAFEKEIKKQASIESVLFRNIDGEEIVVGSMSFVIELKK